MKIRDRIRELRRVPASQLRPNPRNWRSHPPEQQEALQGVLAEIGYADALIARELDNGDLELIDGHLRAETTPDGNLPVLVLDVDQEEADKLLLTLDPLAGMAGVASEQLDALLADSEFQSQQVDAMLDDLRKVAEKAAASLGDGFPEEVMVPESFQVVVECDDEAAQREVYERMTQEGYKCRLLNL